MYKNNYGASPHTNNALGILAARQFGLIGRSQALDAGLSPRTIHYRTTSGEWERLHEGVYRLRGAPPLWEQKLMGAQLWGGPKTDLSHRSAGALFHLDGVPDGFVELLTTGSRTDVPRGIILHRTRNLLRSDHGHLGPFRVTGIPRTLVDLGAVLDPPFVEAAFESAMRRDPDLLPRLLAKLEDFDLRGGGGARVLAQILVERDPDAAATEGLFETLLERTLKEAGLPLPVRQHEIWEDGKLVARIDFAYPEHRLALELDGFKWHWGRRKWRTGLRRGNALTLLGWKTLHITWQDLTLRPDDVVADVRTALGG